MNLSSITVSAGADFDCRGATPRDVQVFHQISAAGSGYVSLRVMKRGVKAALAAGPVLRITAITRAANVVTATCNGHGMQTGDIAVVRGEGTAATPMNGEFQVTVTGANTFTFPQSGGNEAGSVCNLRTIDTVGYNDEGTNLPFADRSAGYHCRAANVNGDLWVQCNVTAGTHTVLVRDAVAGTGAGEVTVRGQGESFAVTPVLLGGAAYAAGDAIGALTTLTNFARANGRGVTIQDLTVADKAAQSLGMQLLFFNANPSASTITDNVPLDIHDNDVAKIIGVLDIFTSSFVDLTSSAVGYAERAITLHPTAASRTLYLAIRAIGAPTYAVGDLVITGQKVMD